MKLYKLRTTNLHYLTTGKPQEYAKCISDGRQWESQFRNEDVHDKSHLFKLIGNNYRQK